VAHKLVSLWGVFGMHSGCTLTKTPQNSTDFMDWAARKINRIARGKTGKYSRIIFESR